MKKAFIILGTVLYLTACSNNGGESGAVDDGFKGAGDRNGGVADTTKVQANGKTDTSRGEDRVDIQKRDSAEKY